MVQASPQEIPTIAHTRAGKVSDEILQSVQDIATQAQNGETLTTAEAHLILLTMPQLCEELLHRRAVMDLIGTAADIDNVFFLHGQG
ncbi:hypothetical protein [Roseovarius atlanticus]|uniref:hypothetical protein n=1 Tax=Roseovarius atlanticus TaxID=1641875 RepID=UPI001C98C5FA|nr:hypothetical protein [Roseovarius atlanticus]MBY5988188.1 hypothetical protein [Roseovarius atlanticus]MBY6123579.1 hypothetical protein [Roseovarius atlanticus]MBY6148074.1 hypothetical protein [Roseovarius atlanticus]